MMRFTTMKTKLRKYPSIFLILLLAISSCFLTGCVNQHPKDSKKSSQGESVETMLEITDPKEKQAVLNAKAKVKALSGNPRIVATSPAVADSIKIQKGKESRTCHESRYGNRIFFKS